MFGGFGSRFAKFGTGGGGRSIASSADLLQLFKRGSEDGAMIDELDNTTDLDLANVNCLQFDGVDDYVVTEPVTLGNSFELEWTGSLSSTESYGTIFGNKSSTNTEGNFTIERVAQLDSINIVFYPNGGTREISHPVSVDFFDGSVRTHKVTANNGALTYVVDNVTVHSNTFPAGNGFTDNSSVGVYGKPNGTSNCGGVLQSFKMSSGGVLLTQLPLAEGSGTKAYDVSGSGNYGTINGATWTTLDGIESWNHEHGFDSSIIDSDNFMTVPVTLLNMQEVASGEVGVRKFTKTAATSSNAFVTFGSYPSLSDGDSYSLKYTIKTDSDSGGSNVAWGGQIIVSSRATGNNNNYTTIDISATSPDKPSSGNNSYWGIAGKNFSGGDYTPNTSGIGIYTYTNHLEQGESLFIKDMTLDIATKIPALNTKTKQVATFDGADDFVSSDVTGLGAGDFYYGLKFRYTFKSATYLFSDGNANSASGGAWSALQYSASTGGLIFVTDDNITKVDEQIIANGTIPDNSIIEGYIQRVSGTISFNLKNLTNDATYSGSYANSTNFFNSNANRKLVLGAAYSATSVVSEATVEWLNFKAGTTSTNLVRHYDFQSDIGTANIVDISGNNNDGDLNYGAGALESFWATRVADASGLLVSADYAAGNLAISNQPALDNGSEVDLVQTDSVFTSGTVSFWSADGSAQDEKTFAQLIDHAANRNGYHRVWVKVIDGRVTAIAQYNLDKDFLPSDVLKNERYFGGASGALRDVNGDFIVDGSGFVIFAG